MDLLEIGMNVVDWIGLAQDRYSWRALVNSVMNLQVPKNAGNYRVAVQPEGKRPLGRPRRRWIDNIKMEPLEIEVGVVDWIDVAQDRYRWRALVNSVMNLRVP
jgi:hypothetical protein